MDNDVCALNGFWSSWQLNNFHRKVIFSDDFWVNEYVSSQNWDDTNLHEIQESPMQREKQFGVDFWLVASSVHISLRMTF